MTSKLTATIGTLTMLLAVAAQAAPVTETFQAVVSNGPFTGTVGTGSITYDRALATDISALGFRCVTCVGPSQGLAIELSVLGQDFTEADEDIPAVFPWLNFDANTITFAIQEEQVLFPGQVIPNPVAIDAPGVAAIWLFSTLNPGTNGFDYDLNLIVAAYPDPVPPTESQPVPIPAASMLPFAAFALCTVKRKSDAAARS